MPLVVALRRKWPLGPEAVGKKRRPTRSHSSQSRVGIKHRGAKRCPQRRRTMRPGHLPRMPWPPARRPGGSPGPSSPSSASVSSWDRPLTGHFGDRNGHLTLGAGTLASGLVMQFPPSGESGRPGPLCGPHLALRPRALCSGRGGRQQSPQAGGAGDLEDFASSQTRRPGAPGQVPAGGFLRGLPPGLADAASPFVHVRVRSPPLTGTPRC